MTTVTRAPRRRAQNNTADAAALDLVMRLMAIRGGSGQEKPVADFVIENAGSLADLEARADEVLEAIRKHLGVPPDALVATPRTERR